MRGIRSMGWKKWPACSTSWRTNNKYKIKRCSGHDPRICFLSFPVSCNIVTHDHCSLEQQVITAETITEVLGDKLVSESEWKNLMNEKGELPSPEQLKGKIIIKGRTSSAAKDDIHDGESSGDESDEEVELPAAAELSNFSSMKEPRSSDFFPDVKADYGAPRSPIFARKDSFRDHEKEKAKIANSKKEKLDGDQNITLTSSFLIESIQERRFRAKVAPELSNITNLKSVNFKKFRGTDDQSDVMSSFTETQLARHIAKSSDALILHNQRYLTRIYPKTTRVDSSNYDPMESWLYGNQIVAMNFQTSDMPMWLNSAHFMQNGGCGYVLKPPQLTEFEFSNPAASDNVQVVLKIRVISAWQLPKEGGKSNGEIIDPFAVVGIHGCALDSNTKPLKTPVVKNNGYNPVWESYGEFPLRFLSLALLKIVVLNGSSSSYIAHSITPVTLLKKGFRSLPLYNAKGMLEGSSILVHVQIVRDLPKRYHEYTGKPGNFLIYSAKIQ